MSTRSEGEWYAARGSVSLLDRSFAGSYDYAFSRAILPPGGGAGERPRESTNRAVVARERVARPAHGAALDIGGGPLASWGPAPGRRALPRRRGGTSAP